MRWRVVVATSLLSACAFGGGCSSAPEGECGEEATCPPKHSCVTVFTTNQSVSADVQVEGGGNASFSCDGETALIACPCGTRPTLLESPPPNIVMPYRCRSCEEDCNDALKECLDKAEDSVDRFLCNNAHIACSGCETYTCAAST